MCIRDSIVPLRGHTLRDGELHLAFPKERIDNAPDLDEDGHLTNEDQEAFYRHYGLEGTQDVTTYETDARHAAPVADVDRREVDVDRNADNDTLVRSEEQLNVNKERVDAGQVRLRKYVVNETETVEVPVQREEVRVVREPITDADRTNYDGNLSDDEASLTLTEERVSVNKETVPVEKVSLDKETVQSTERVSEELQKERIETDGVVVDETRDVRPDARPDARPDTDFGANR